MRFTKLFFQSSNRNAIHQARELTELFFQNSTSNEIYQGRINKNQKAEYSNIIITIRPNVYV